MNYLSMLTQLEIQTIRKMELDEGINFIMQVYGLRKDQAQSIKAQCDEKELAA